MLRRSIGFLKFYPCIEKLKLFVLTSFKWTTYTVHLLHQWMVSKVRDGAFSKHSWKILNRLATGYRRPFILVEKVIVQIVLNLNLTNKYIKLNKTLDCVIVSINLQFLLSYRSEFSTEKFVDKKFFTTQKMKFSIKGFFTKCDQIRSFLWVWSHLRKKSLMENFISCSMPWVCKSDLWKTCSERLMYVQFRSCLYGVGKVLLQSALIRPGFSQIITLSASIEYLIFVIIIFCCVQAFCNLKKWGRKRTNWFNKKMLQSIIDCLFVGIIRLKDQRQSSLNKGFMTYSLWKFWGWFCLCSQLKFWQLGNKNAFHFRKVVVIASG